MTILAVASAVLYLTLLLELWRLQDRHAKAEAAWTRERRELLTRIQAPERIPILESEPLDMPEREPDQFGQVGEVLSISDTYGLED